MPVSVTAHFFQRQRLGVSCQEVEPHGHLATLRELHGIADQVQNLRSRVGLPMARSGISVGRKQSQVQPFPAGSANRSTASSIVSRGSTSKCSRSSLPASIFEKSKLLSMMLSSAGAGLVYAVSQVQLFVDQWGLINGSVMPRMSFIGV